MDYLQWQGQAICSETEYKTHKKKNCSCLGVYKFWINTSVRCLTETIVNSKQNIPKWFNLTCYKSNSLDLAA